MMRALRWWLLRLLRRPIRCVRYTVGDTDEVAKRLAEHQRRARKKAPLYP